MKTKKICGLYIGEIIIGFVTAFVFMAVMAATINSVYA